MLVPYAAHVKWLIGSPCYIAGKRAVPLREQLQLQGACSNIVKMQSDNWELQQAEVPPCHADPSESAWEVFSLLFPALV